MLNFRLPPFTAILSQFILNGIAARREITKMSWSFASNVGTSARIFGRNVSNITAFSVARQPKMNHALSQVF